MARPSTRSSALSMGVIRKERSAVHGKVARWRVRWVDESGHEQTKVFA
jgi:hypothetical protein